MTGLGLCNSRTRDQSCHTLASKCDSCPPHVRAQGRAIWKISKRIVDLQLSACLSSLHFDKWLPETSCKRLLTAAFVTREDSLTRYGIVTAPAMLPHHLRRDRSYAHPSKKRENIENPSEDIGGRIVDKPEQWRRLCESTGH